MSRAHLTVSNPEEDTTHAGAFERGRIVAACGAPLAPQLLVGPSPAAGGGEVTCRPCGRALRQPNESTMTDALSLLVEAGLEEHKAAEAVDYVGRHFPADFELGPDSTSAAVAFDALIWVGGADQGEAEDAGDHAQVLALEAYHDLVLARLRELAPEAGA